MRAGKSSSRKTAPLSLTVPRRRSHYISPKLGRKSRAEKGGYGVFALEPVEAGELLVVWGGVIVTVEELAEQPLRARRHSLQVEENLYLVTLETAEVGDYVNHSCTPNAGMSGQTALVAVRPILAGEEICYDYAMSDGSPYDEFACSCSSPYCRRRVTGNDWALPELQLRYAGYFSPYLQRRIAGGLRATSRTGASMVDLLDEAPARG